MDGWLIGLITYCKDAQFDVKTGPVLFSHRKYFYVHAKLKHQSLADLHTIVHTIIHTHLNST